MDNETIIEITDIGKVKTTHAGKVYEGQIGFIESQRVMLENYRDDGRVPSKELLDDIKAYNCILDCETSEARCKEYMDYKYCGEDVERAMGLRPRDVARTLGWMK